MIIMRRKRILKQLAQRVAWQSGTSAAVGRVRRERRAPAGSVEIFFGHHVVADDAPAGLRAKDLYDRLRYLRRTRHLVSLPEAAEWLRKERSRRLDRLAVVTFDDGYRDNLTHLLPVLQAADAPATIFVATGPVLDGGYLWFDRARAALQAATEEELGTLKLDGLGAQPASQEAILTHLKHASPVERHRYLTEMLTALSQQEPPPEQRMMSVEELQRLAADPHVMIGAHTHSHQILSCCDKGQAEEELSANLRALQGILWATPSCFAYPNGQAGDFDDLTAGVLRQRGIAVAVTTLPGLNPPGTPLLQLGRLPLGEGPVEGFVWQTELRSA